jgi:hypothetical protein
VNGVALSLGRIVRALSVGNRRKRRAGRLVSIDAGFSLECGTKPESAKNREKWGSADKHHGDASDRRDKHGHGNGVDDGLSDYHARQVRRDQALFNPPNWRASIRRKRPFRASSRASTFASSLTLILLDAAEARGGQAQRAQRGASLEQGLAETQISAAGSESIASRC